MSIGNDGLAIRRRPGQALRRLHSADLAGAGPTGGATTMSDADHVEGLFNELIQASKSFPDPDEPATNETRIITLERVILAAEGVIDALKSLRADNSVAAAQETVAAHLKEAVGRRAELRAALGPMTVHTTDCFVQRRPTPKEWRIASLEAAVKSIAAVWHRQRSGLDDEDLDIIRKLAELEPLMLTAGQIAGHTHISEKTVKKRMRKLIGLGLVDRPAGQKSGAMITSEGKALLDRMDKITNTP